MSNLFFLPLVVFIIGFIEKSELVRQLDDSPEDSISTLCEIPGKIEGGYCVPIYNCLSLIKSNLSQSELIARKCGSHNENVKKPKVCCEKSAVKFGTNSASESNIVFPENETKQTELQGCGTQIIESRLIGGNSTVKKEFPWLSRLLRKDVLGEVRFSCTGALISSKVVLTTAHCLVSDSLEEFGDLYAVSLGEHETVCSSDVNECLRTKKTVLISNYIAHPLYDKHAINHDNDIGLIFLKTRVQFTNYITPICLLKNKVDLTEYYIGGWGKTESGTVSNVKLKISVPPFSWQQCVDKYKTINVNLTRNQVCAGGVEGVDSCQGDSGGPLMVQKNMQWYVAGVVSFGVACGKKGWPGVYIDVPSYVNWITQNVEEKV